MGNSQDKKKNDNPNPKKKGEVSSFVPSIENEKMANIKYRLKKIFELNFLSLSFEDLNAHYIQMQWKQHIISKTRKARRGVVEVIYSPIDKNPNVSSRQDRLFVLLDSKRYPYRCYDLVKYKALKKVVEKFGGYENLPTIFLNGYYLGSSEQFQNFEELRLSHRIIDKEYLKRCLMCNMPRPHNSADVCSYCYKTFNFFSKSETRMSVHENRFNEGELNLLDN